MAWAGYFTFGGIEIINVARTEAYAEHAGLGWFKSVWRNQALPLILDETYTSPLMDDDTPWVDPDMLASYDFYGAYPLDVTGIENSTVTATIVESTKDGGVIQRPRHATKTIVFSAVLVGGSEAAVEHGMRWLTTVLNQCGCLDPRRHGGGLCGGQILEYLSSEPAVDLNYTTGSAISTRTIVDGGTPAAPGATKVDGLTPVRTGAQLVNGGDPEIRLSVETAPTFDLTECLPEYLRSMHKVTCTTGPTVTAKMPISTGGAAWTVEWTVVAGDPNRYAYPQPIVVGFLDPTVPVPYPGDQVPPGAVWDATGYKTTDPSCPVVVYRPLWDPDCELLVAPPAVPTINPTCFDFPASFTRRTFTLPKQDIALWWGTVPIITIHTPSVRVQNLRFRFFEDDDSDFDPDDPCNPEGDLVFSYLPGNSIVTFDGVTHQIYADVPGYGRSRADSVVTDSKGGPFSWPELSCGCAYVVTVDMEMTQVVPVIDLTLVKKAC